MDPQTEHTESFPAAIAGVWAERVTLRMCEEVVKKMATAMRLEAREGAGCRPRNCSSGQLVRNHLV